MEKKSEVEEDGDIVKIDIEEKSGEEQKFIMPGQYLPFYWMTDLQDRKNFMILIAFRIFEAIFCSHNMLYPDEYWQSTEVAYEMVYGGVRLPWEWNHKFRIRNTIYPYYLSLALRILDFLNLDYYFTVRLGYYLLQTLLVIIGDYFYFQIGCKVFGSHSARVSLYIYLSNRFYNMYIIRCFGNSVESILQLIIFNFYYDITNKFDKNIFFVAFLTTVSFMIRCTSPIGWIFLVLYKVIKERAILQFILGFFLVCLPTMGCLVLLDSIYYQEYTFVPYLFMKMNLIENVSENFGIAPPLEYIKNSIPYALNLSVIFVLLGIFNNLNEFRCKYQFPYFIVLIFTYILVFSLIPHKEDRFILPTIPFFILLAGDYLYKKMKTGFYILSKLLLITVIYELIITVGLVVGHNKAETPVLDMMHYDPNPHQLFHAHRFDLPAYSLIHKHQLKDRVEFLFPFIQDGNFGVHFYTGGDHYCGWCARDICNDLVQSIHNGWWPPKYAVLQTHGDTDCMNRLLEYYDLVNTYETPLKKLSYWLRFEVKDYQLFQKKDTGQILIPQFKN